MDRSAIAIIIAWLILPGPSSIYSDNLGRCEIYRWHNHGEFHSLIRVFILKDLLKLRLRICGASNE